MNHEPSLDLSPTEAPIAPETPPAQPPPAVGLRSVKVVPLVLGAAVLVILGTGGLLIWRAEAKTNKIALASSPKPVTVIAARAKAFQPSRIYVGTLDAWLSASIGPQLVSAYVDTVLVRPGAIVKRGEVLATLDCRDASAASQAVAMEARAIDSRQKALASESARLHTLLAGNFVSQNDVEKQAAASAAEAAQLQATRAKLSRQALGVNDCILRAPFDGEVATRTIDPGAFVRPGVSLVSVVDRSTLRLSADAPEVDFDVIAPGREVRVDIIATKQTLVGVIARRAPAADPSTRTVHFEVDLPDPERTIPVGTTGQVHLDVGEPVPATEIPIYAASVRGKKATLFVIEGDVARARTVAVKGEVGGSLFVEAALAPGTMIVTEGRALLADGDRVTPRMESDAIASAAPVASAAPKSPIRQVKATSSAVVPVPAVAKPQPKEPRQ